MADVFSSLLGDEQQAQPQSPAPKSAFDPSKSYGTPTKLLDNLRHTESGGDPYAVNKTTGAMGQYQFMPATIAMLRKQGVTFDPFDPQQARNAADWYIQQLKQQNGGTYEGAMKAYGGFVTKDPSQYVGKVMAGVPTTPGQSYPGQQPAAYSAPTNDIFSPLLDAKPQASAPAQTQPSQPQQPQQSQQSAQKPQSPLAQVANRRTWLDEATSGATEGATRFLSQLAGMPVAGLAGLGQLALSGGDVGRAADTVSNVSNALTYEPKTTGGKIAGEIVDLPGKVIEGASNIGGQAVENIANAAGASPQTTNALRSLTEFGIKAAPVVYGTAKQFGGGGGSVTADAAAQAAPAVNAADKPRYRPNGDGTFTQVSPNQPNPVTSTGPMAANPATGTLEPVQVADLPKASNKPVDMFPSPSKTPMAKGQVSTAEQAHNVNVLKAIGLNQARDSLVTGDPFQSGVEYQNARAQTPIGDVTRQAISEEQTALRNYADRVNNMTGRDATLGPEGVGQKIVAPLEKMSDWFDTKAGDLYKKAREAAGDVPLSETPALTNLLSDPDMADRMAASTDGQALYNAVQRRYARFAGLGNEAGEGAIDAPARTITNAENFRQFVNQVGRDNPKFGNFIGRVKQALDEDVGAAGGGGLFNEARQMWQQRQQMLADPNGISKLLDPDGNGLNRSVSLEKVGQRIMGMDGANFRNLLGSMDKIKKMAPELAPDVDAAMSELRGQATKQLTDAGGSGQYWNANKFSQTAQNLSPKLRLMFDDGELGAIRTLNEAGRIIRQPGAYPGAAVQHINMFRSGIATAIPYSTAAAGGAMFGPLGVAGGQLIGGKLSSLVSSGGEKAIAAKLATKYAKNLNR